MCYNMRENPTNGFVLTFSLCLPHTMVDNLKLSIYDFVKQILASRSMVSAIVLRRYKMCSSKAILVHH